MNKHPIQPLEKDKQGTLRFKKNRIVECLLNNSPFDLNRLAAMEFSDNDREQFAQLLGYSFGGFSELSYVSDETYLAAENLAKHGDAGTARAAALRETLDKVREAMRDVVPLLFRIHPDDLKA